MVQARAKSSRRSANLGAALGVSRELADAKLAKTGDALARKRRLIAAFCRMLGEQLMGNNTASSF